MKVIKGETSEQQLDHVDKILDRMSRRLHKTVVGIIPPNLTFNYIKTPGEDGVLLRAIFPGGKLTKGFMFIDKYADKNAVNFIAELIGLQGTQSRTFNTRKQLLIFEPNLDLEIGDRLIFKTDEPTKIEGVWIGFLFQIDIKDSVQKTYVIEQLELLNENEKVGDN
jgi:hypothetical protein